MQHLQIASTEQPNKLGIFNTRPRILTTHLNSSLNEEINPKYMKDRILWRPSYSIKHFESFFRFNFSVTVFNTHLTQK